MHLNYGDYIVYIDESGDHGMGRIDPGYPIFVLACCISKKCLYQPSGSGPARLQVSPFWA